MSDDIYCLLPFHSILCTNHTNLPNLSLLYIFFTSVKGGVNGGDVNGISLDEGGFHKVDDVNIGPGKFIFVFFGKLLPSLIVLSSILSRYRYCYRFE